jgi:hypothetical protein
MHETFQWSLYSNLLKRFSGLYIGPNTYVSEYMFDATHRIRRGKDWKWDQQDKKSSDPKSGRGTVVSVGDWVSVRWDHGATNSYRYSTKAGGYDIELDCPSSTDAPALFTMPIVPSAIASSFQPLFPLFLREIFLQGLSAAGASFEAWSTFCLKFEKMLCPPGFP